MTDDEFFADLYRRRRDPDIRYVAAKMQRAPNKFWLGLEAAEIFDEVMEKYYFAGEHLDRDANHEQQIRYRLKLRLVDVIRRERAEKRTLPGPSAIGLGSQSRADDDDDDGLSPDEPVDQAFAKAVFDIETEDAVSRLDNEHQRAVRLRLDGKTHEQIGAELGVSPETARQRLLETRHQLKDDP